MRGYVLQDWITIRGATTMSSVIQSASGYLDLSPFEDFVAWVEVEELTATGVTSPTLWLETAPTDEETFFIAPQGGVQTSVSLAVGLTTAKNLFSNPLPSNQIPLARWLRWRLAMSGAASVWSVTFRVHVAAHSMCLPVAG